MQIEDSYIAGISCTPPENGHPLTSLTFKGLVDFQPVPDKQLDIQSFRNLRNSLEDRRNFGAAYVIRELELRNERSSQSFLPKSFSFLYDFSSAYGNSPERAAAWAALIISYNGLLIGINELYRTYQCWKAVPSKFWVEVLCREDYMSNVASIIFFGLRPIFDPLNFIRSDQIVSASNFWINLWLSFSNIVILALIGIIILGVRRRMRE